MNPPDSGLVLAAHDLKRSYHQGSTEIPVLRGVNLFVRPREKIAIIGQSGSGKTTLLSILSGLDDPDSGQVTILGQPLNSLSEKLRADLRARSLGFVFQNFRLIPYLNAVENVMFPLMLINAAHSKERSEQILNQLGLSHRFNHTPDQLSGGEMQRVALARALVTQPKLIFADEPSGNLDPKTGNEVMDLLFRCVTENASALILVTHNHALTKSCDRTLTVHDGLLE